ncbi:CCA tRNA nucleotidyltransferase [Citricoccus zhacaiensis]|uniref:CCA tRNA nucleotidyltransferase n=1 Tax=Citricoccus zhacaiensis TaxID=489142 RepID=A0ABQ2LT90_9MICC|nr:HD domain-containing protein [Citricoccus zhacaiensis]GGO42924.1 CCA tRNA nucleotidyltransferase [Citricoccus zhacaiensis]
MNPTAPSSPSSGTPATAGVQPSGTDPSGLVDHTDLVALPVGFPTGAGLPPVVLELGRLFKAAGHELSLVGGPVRDLFLGRVSPDLDFTTDADPDTTLRIARKWADAHWDIGRKFGTIGFSKGGWQLEVTTYRAEKYDRDSRKPQVAFGDSLDEDLLRRDFTVNAMAIRLPSLELVDLFGGVKDLAAGRLRTPGTPEDSFSDDPLRMMRAARFASQLGIGVDPSVVEAMTAMAERITIISAERVRDELVKLVNGSHPRAGLNLLVDTGLAEHVLPELPALKLETDEHHRHKDVYEHSLTVLEQAMDHEYPAELEERWAAEHPKAPGGGPAGTGESGEDSDGEAETERFVPPSGTYVPAPDFVLRFAALMHDVGKPATRRFEPNGAVTFRHHDVVGAKLVKQRMRALKFDNDTIKAVARLVELHMRFYGYGDAGWTDSAVRRYVNDAGPVLPRLHALTRSDVTTRNRRKAERLAFAYDDLERRMVEIAEKEELQAVRPDLDGSQVMQILGIKPGPVVGRAYKHLLEYRLDEGPHDVQTATAELLRWWAEQPESTA